MVLAYDYPLLAVLVSLLGLALVVAWLIGVSFTFADLFTSPDVSGAAKAGWTVVVLCLPLLGVGIYLTVHGRDMADRMQANVGGYGPGPLTLA